MTFLLGREGRMDAGGALRTSGVPSTKPKVAKRMVKFKF
jgi:hypothetical protein